MAVLENEFIRLEISEKGTLEGLLNKKTGQQYAGGGGLWRLYFQIDDQMDREVLGCECEPQITLSANRIELSYPTVNYQGRQLMVSVLIAAWLDGDETRWSIELENNEDIMLHECEFPLVHNLQLKPEQPLLWSDRGGMIFPDIRQEIKRGFTHYVASDHLFLHKDVEYPGTATTNCFVFPAEQEGLYCACYDETFGETLHMFRLYGAALECGFARYPCLARGQNCRLEEYVLSPYIGSWHTAAQKYRTWADKWFKHQTPPEWVKAMKGWQRIILKHQYGEIHYDYEDIAKIHEDGLEAGIDGLHLFGWWKGGMDNSNPDYIADNSLGGHEKLKEQIQKFQKNGSVILYCNGRLIDLDTDYYKTVGKRISIKDKFGAEIRDAYKFSASGTYTRHFGNRTFTAACPACPEWLDKMKEVVDLAIEYGCKGVFFDQLGMNEFPCFDPTHGHEVPFMHISRKKAELVRELRDYARSKAPKLGIGIECLTDLSASYCDFIHSFPGFAEASNDWEGKSEKPVLTCFIDWFRYCFPEIIMTDREIRDDTDVERRVNHALLKGLRSDVEIYRCRRTIAETPNYSAYLAKANVLRDKYAELILNGKYLDTTGFNCDNSEVEGRAFVAGNKCAVVLTQSHLAQTKAVVSVADSIFREWGMLGEVLVENSRPGPGNGTSVEVTLPRHGLAVLVFETAN